MKNYYLVVEVHNLKILLIKIKNNQEIQKLHFQIIIIKKNLKNLDKDLKIQKKKKTLKKKTIKFKYLENNKQVILIKKKQEV